MKKIAFAAALLVASFVQAATEKACTLHELTLGHKIFETEHRANRLQVELAQSQAMRIRPDLADQIYQVQDGHDAMTLDPSLDEAWAEDQRNYSRTCEPTRMYEAIQASRYAMSGELMRLSRLTGEPRDAK